MIGVAVDICTKCLDDSAEWLAAFVAEDSAGRMRSFTESLCRDCCIEREQSEQGGYIWELELVEL